MAHSFCVLIFVFTWSFLVLFLLSYVFYSILNNWGQNYNKAENSDKIFAIVLFYSAQRDQPTVRGPFLHPLDYRILTTKLHSSRLR